MGTARHVYSARFGDGASQAAYAISLDAAGNVFVSGVFSGEIDFGTGPLKPKGKQDVFLAKLGR